MVNSEEFNGSDCSGSNGVSNRTLTISNSIMTLDRGFEVYVDGFFLHPIEDHTINHKNQNSIITFLNPISDTQKISIIYWEEI